MIRRREDLFDHGTPAPLRRYLHPHSVDTAAELGWSELENEELIQAAEDADSHLLVTTDTNLRYQQNLENRRIGIVVLRRSSWPKLRSRIDDVVAGISNACPGDYIEI
jgi:hypothetical protein